MPTVSGPLGAGSWSQRFWQPSMKQNRSSPSSRSNRSATSAACRRRVKVLRGSSIGRTSWQSTRWIKGQHPLQPKDELGNGLPDDLLDVLFSTYPFKLDLLPEDTTEDRGGNRATWLPKNPLRAGKRPAFATERLLQPTAFDSMVATLQNQVRFNAARRDSRRG